MLLGLFLQHDADGNGVLDCAEFRNIFAAADFLEPSHVQVTCVRVCVCVSVCV